MYTSGTAGEPKAVMLSHRNVLFAARTSVLLRQTAPGDHVYAVLPMSHIVGFSILLVATLMGGATAHLVAKYDPAALAKALAEDGITDLFGVPATYQRLLEHKAVRGIGRLQAGRLRRMLVAGAPLDLELKARVEAEFAQPLLNNYGITECSPGLSGVRAHRPRNDEFVGELLPGVRASSGRLPGHASSARRGRRTPRARPECDARLLSGARARRPRRSMVTAGSTPAISLASMAIIFSSSDALRN